MKAHADGSIQGFTARMRWPGYHNGAPQGLWYIDPESLERRYALALQAGIPVATLRDMRKLWPAKPLTVPLGVLSEMVANGVSRTVATRRVRDLLLKGANLTQFASLGTNVRNDIAAGLAPDAAMELRSKGVLSLIESQAAFGISASTPPRPPTKR